MMTSNDFAKIATRFNFLFKVYEPSVKGRPKVKKFGAYFHPITGFDVVRFDSDVKPAKLQRLRDAVASKFGEDAATLVSDLCHYRPDA